ncbi:MAG: hypothetical protein KGR24_06700 [Planctomycetes bacterium]|nr:hypothetical protein [Planctomycetota bacterium]
MNSMGVQVRSMASAAFGRRGHETGPIFKDEPMLGRIENAARVGRQPRE